MTDPKPNKRQLEQAQLLRDFIRAEIVLNHARDSMDHGYFLDMSDRADKLFNQIAGIEVPE